MDSRRTLVVGAGSIGRRHLRNLRAAGARTVAACDLSAERLAALAAESAPATYSDFERALAEFRPEIVFICTPPTLHLGQLRQSIEAGAHVFVEKPLAAALDGVDAAIADAERKGRIVQVGYNLRFHRGLQEVRRRLGEIGKVLWAQSEFGQYLPDWRKDQDYRQSYTAQRRLGGGILLDASHELDYVLWLLGRPTEVSCRAGKVSALEVDVEDSVTVLLGFPGGVQADVHVDFVQRAYSRSCKLAGELGTIVWDYPGQQVRLFRADRGTWETVEVPADPNDMYVAELAHFLTCIERNEKPLVDLRQAADVVRLVLSAKAAAASGAKERMAW